MSPLKKAAPAKKADTKPAPRRPTLDPETKRLLLVRDDLSGRRPKFVRTASNRYWRIGRWNSWRRTSTACCAMRRSPSSESVRPTALAAPPSSRVAKPPLTTATPAHPRTSSPMASKRPATDCTPRASKNAPLTTAPLACRTKPPLARLNV